MTRRASLSLSALLLAAGASLSGPGICQAAGSGWDADGGYTGDYSAIPKLEWRGPGQPGTHADYLRRRGSTPFTTRHVATARPAGEQRSTSKALVIVDTTLRAGIQARLDIYVTDLVEKDYTVEVHEVSGGTHLDLKNLILNNATDLVGCVFVGDLAAAWFEDDLWGPEQFPCDLFFMDLDGTWTDGDGNGKYELHSGGGGDVGPEIFIGRIDASMMSGNEVDMTNAYLLKNHLYRTGGYAPTNHALTYTEDDWAMFWDMRTDIGGAYSSFDDVPAPATNRDDYVQSRITDPAYEFIQLACHSWSGGHAFTRGGYVYSSQIQSAPPQAIYYNLFCCSSLRYTDSDYVGGSYIYDTGTPSLAVIGSTKTGSMLVFSAFYNRLGNFKSFGESFRGWFNYIAPYDANELAWHYGMTIAGDPFLSLEPYDPCKDPVNFCTTSPNSVGSGATMTWDGSPSLSTADLTLIALGCPPNQFGIFYYGASQISTPFGDGVRCVGSGGFGIYRFPPFQTDLFGGAFMDIDFGAPPAGSGSGMFFAGEKWMFQFWYRDPAAGGSGFNLSDGLSVEFCP